MTARDRYMSVIRVTLALVLILFIIRRIDERQLLVLLGDSFRARWAWWVSALAATYFGLHIGVLRWFALLRANGLVVRFGIVFRDYFIGQFFNAFMLGACGGDMARAVAVTRTCPEQKAAALSTVVMDRGIGLLVTVAVGCLAVLFRLHLFNLSRTNRWAAILMFVFLVGAFAAMILLFGRNVFEHLAFFRRLERSSQIGPLLRRAYEAFYFYRHHPKVVWQAGVLSLFNLLALTLACLLAGRALGLPVRALDYLTFFPIITVLAAVPLTPGSLGLRENLFMAMFGSVGARPEQAVSLSLAVYATGLFWSLFGGLLLALNPLSRSPQSNQREGMSP